MALVSYKEIFILASNPFILPAFFLMTVAESWQRRKSFCATTRLPKDKTNEINNIETNPANPDLKRLPGFWRYGW